MRPRFIPPRRTPRMGAAARRPLRCERLEGREVPAVFPVTTTADSGPGSLRQAILDANSTPGADAIQFNIGSGAQTIALAAALPDVTEAVTIDGTTQPGYAGTPLITLSHGTGFGTNGTASGLHLVNHRGSVIRGLAVY